jgi:hypothetical protein
MEGMMAAYPGKLKLDIYYTAVSSSYHWFQVEGNRKDSSSQ